MKILHENKTFHVNFVSEFKLVPDAGVRFALKYMSVFAGVRFAEKLEKQIVEEVLAEANNHKMIRSSAPNCKLNQIRITYAQFDEEIAVEGSAPKFVKIRQEFAVQSPEDQDNKYTGKVVALGKLLKSLKLGDEFNQKVWAEFKLNFKNKTK